MHDVALCDSIRHLRIAACHEYEDTIIAAFSILMYFYLNRVCERVHLLGIGIGKRQRNDRLEVIVHRSYVVKMSGIEDHRKIEGRNREERTMMSRD